MLIVKTRPKPKKIMRYGTKFWTRSDHNDLRSDHLPGVIAISLIVVPLQKKAIATKIINNPNQIAQQSSVLYNSDILPVGFAIISSSCFFRYLRGSEDHISGILQCNQILFFVKNSSLEVFIEQLQSLSLIKQGGCLLIYRGFIKFPLMCIDVLLTYFEETLTRGPLRQVSPEENNHLFALQLWRHCTFFCEKGPRTETFHPMPRKRPF